ncbi:hypothetical protein GQ457_11G027350 [Hibiscus cannabinus]
MPRDRISVVGLKMSIERPLFIPGKDHRMDPLFARLFHPAPPPSSAPSQILGYIYVAILDLFNQLEHGINLVPAILAETFIPLNVMSLKEDTSGDALPCSWFGSKAIFGKHLRLYYQWDKVDPSKWVEAFRNLQEQDLVWRTPWLRTRSFLYRCYEYNWPMLLGLWGGIDCAPLLGKQTIEQYQQALNAEKDNTAAWKWKSHDSKIRLTKSHNAYNALEIQLNQCRAHYVQLEARVKVQEDMIREYQTRDEYTELQAGRNKIETLEKEVKDLWAMVQTCQISIQVLEDIKKGGNDYWFTRLRDAAH